MTQTETEIDSGGTDVPTGAEDAMDILGEKLEAAQGVVRDQAEPEPPAASEPDDAKSEKKSPTDLPQSDGQRSEVKADKAEDKTKASTEPEKPALTVHQ